MDLAQIREAAEAEGIVLDENTLNLTQSFVLGQKIRRKDDRKERNKALRLWIPVALGLLSATGYGGWKVVRVEPDPEAATIEDSVSASKDLDKQVQTNSAKIEVLGVIAVEQQELTVESAHYIGDKIDAAHPKTADAVDKPPALKKAEDIVDDRTKKAKAGELFKDIEVK
jgi:hypothetical protein